MTMRASLGGNVLRVRLSNAYGRRPLEVGAAHIGCATPGRRLRAGSDRKLTFGGDAAATIAAGALLISDPVELDVPPLADLAVSVYLPGDIPAELRHHRPLCAADELYLAARRFRRRDVMPIGRITDDWYFLSGVDVLAQAGTGGIVALGDSLTDAQYLDARRVLPLARPACAAAVARSGGRPIGVMNQGLGGNRILHDMRGDSGLRRFDRDVLAQPGVTHVIVMLGTNDLRNRWAKPEEEATAPADDRRAEADGAAGARARDQDLRRHADPVRERDLPAGRLEPGARGGTPGGQCLDPGRQRVRCGGRLRPGRCATRNIRPACCRSTIAATTCTRVILATTGWAM